MLVKTSAPVTPAQVRRWSYEIAEAFYDTFSIARPGEWSWTPNGRHALEIVDQYDQDGDPITREPGETMIEVNLRGCYYGVDYERGDLPSIIAVARWLEERIPGARVYYGGVLAEPFDAAAREALWRHFLANGHRPYRGRLAIAEVVSCDFCGGAPMNNVGGGGGDTFYHCPACDLRVRKSRTGEAIETDRDWKPLEVTYHPTPAGRANEEAE